MAAATRPRATGRDVYQTVVAAYAAEGLSHFIKRFNYQNNLIGSVNLINASVNTGVRCFVFTSSIAVYGAGQTPMTEDLVPQPEDSYGIAKLAVEQTLTNKVQALVDQGNLLAASKLRFDELGVAYQRDARALQAQGRLRELRQRSQDSRASGGDQLFLAGPGARGCACLGQQLQCALELDGEYAVALGDGLEFSVMADIGAEAPDVDDDLLTGAGMRSQFLG